jgi:hypothetical protein
MGNIITVTEDMSIEDIQNYLKRSGSTIIFKPGDVFNLDRILRLYSNTRIILDGAKLVRKARCYVFLTHTDANTTRYNGQHNIMIQGGTIIADGERGSSNIISLAHANNININKLTILRNVGNHAIEVNSSSNVVIDGCSLKGNHIAKGGEFREAIQIDFAASFAMTYIPDASARCYDDTHSSGVTIQNCNISGYNMGIGTHTQTASRNKHKDINILNNTFTGIGAVKGYGSAIKILNMEDVHIIGNKISGFGRGIEITSSNRFYSTTGRKTMIKPAYITGSQHIEIEDNVIKDPSPDFADSGIYINSKFKSLIHNDISIENNTFELKNGKSKCSISCKNATNVTKKDNKSDI